MRIRCFLWSIVVLLSWHFMYSCYKVDVDFINDFVCTVDSNFNNKMNSLESYESVSSDVASSTALDSTTSYNKITISGFLGWNDALEDNIHPAQHFKVGVWRHNVLFNKLLGSTFTDEDGNYVIDFYTNVNNNSDLNIFVEFCPETEHVVVMNKQKFLTRIEISKDDLVDNNVTLNVLINNDDVIQEAYSVIQALQYASNYVNEMEGKYLPQIEVNYPASESDGTSYSSRLKRINILAEDAYDWDVVMHEYGHYVADMLKFKNDIGGSHSFDTILTDVLDDKFDGIELAWNEGWATYFSLSCQKYFSLNELNVINEFLRNAIGDNTYDDVVENIPISDDVKFRRMGEANEHSIAGFLLCLADDDVETNIDNFAYGFKDIWDLIVINKITCMSDFCQHLYAAHSFDFSEIGSLETWFCLSVDLDESTISNYKIESFSFSWVIPFPNIRYSLNCFALKIYDKYKQPYYAINDITDNFYKPSIKEWELILSGTDGDFYWAIEGCATIDYLTGPYVSEFKKLVKPNVYLLTQDSYGFEPQYFFYEKNKEIIINDLIINTSRLRTGYIENEYIVLSPKRKNAGTAYLEYSLNKKIYALGAELCFWSGIEELNNYNGTCSLQYKNENGEWVTLADFLNGYIISTNRLMPTYLLFTFEVPVNEIRFIATAYPEGDRNKGRLCVGNISFYV